MCKKHNIHIFCDWNSYPFWALVTWSGWNITSVSSELHLPFPQAFGQFLVMFMEYQCNSVEVLQFAWLFWSSHPCDERDIIYLVLLISLCRLWWPVFCSWPSGKENIWLLVDTSRGHGISVSCLSLSLPLHSLQPLLSAGSSESCCFLDYHLRERAPSPSYSHSPAQNSGLVCRDLEFTFFSSVLCIIIFLQSDFQWWL